LSVLSKPQISFSRRSLILRTRSFQNKSEELRLSLDAVRVVGFIKTANSVLAQVAHPPDSLVSNKPEELRLSLDAVRVVGFIKTANSVLAQVAHPPVYRN